MPEIDDDDDDEYVDDDKNVLSSFQRISNTIGTRGGPINYDDAVYNDDDDDDEDDDDITDEDYDL